MNRKVLLHIGMLVVTMTVSVETSACFLPPEAYMDFTGQGDYYYSYYMYALRACNEIT